jgi:type II secretory pathway component PulF
MLTLRQKLSITLDHRKEWYRAMAKTIEAGIPVDSVLNVMSRDFAAVKHPMLPLVNELRRRLGGGARVSAVDDRKVRSVGTELNGLVPTDEAMLILSGSESGKPSEGFMSAVRLAESRAQIRDAIQSAMLQPLVYIAAIFGLLFFFSSQILPQFIKVKPRIQWPGAAQVFGTVADNAPWILLAFIALTVLVIVLFQRILPNWTGDSRDFCDKHVWPFTLVAEISGSSLLTSLSAYLSAGKPVFESVTSMMGSASPYMANQCRRMTTQIGSGKVLHEAIKTLPIIQKRYHWLIGIYGLTPDSAQAYRDISDEMTRAVINKVKVTFDYVISNIFLLATAGMILWAMFSLYGVAISKPPVAAVHTYEGPVVIHAAA